MSTLVATVGIVQTPYTPSADGVVVAGVALVITDNSGQPASFGTDSSGNPITSKLLTGKETPIPWSASGTGVDGQGEASFTAQCIDSTGANVGTPLIFTETGTGGVTPPSLTFPQPVLAGSSLVVTG